MLGGGFDLSSLTWSCMVCGDERPDQAISVRHRAIPGFEPQFPGTRTNVRYCNDRAGCVTAAMVDGPWPLQPPAREDSVLELTQAAEDTRVWVTNDQLSMLAVGILTWLRDGATPVTVLAENYQEPIGEVLDAARLLVSCGMVKVVPFAPC